MPPRRPARPRRRSSLTEYRVPPGYAGAVESRAGQLGQGQASPALGVGEEWAAGGGGGGGVEVGAKGKERGLWENQPARRVGVGEHPFAGSAQLLRRCVSDEELGGEGAGEGEAEESEFESDVSSGFRYSSFPT